MKIENIENFIEKLKTVSQNTDSYMTYGLLCRTNKPFILNNTSKSNKLIRKKLKNLNTYDIILIAEQYLNELEKPLHKDLNQKNELKLKLANSVNLYAQRVSKSKPWYKKIVTQLGFVSSIEYRMQLITSKIHLKNNESIKKNRVTIIINSLTSILFKICCAMYDNNIFFWPWKDLKIFYHKMCEESEEIKFLDGLPFYISINSIVNDLEDFQKTENFTDTSKQTQTLINALKFSSDISYSSLFSDNEVIANLIFDQFNQLAESTENSYMILPGGYKNHAVLYLIEKANDGTYSFSIFNTGSGATEHQANKYDENFNVIESNTYLTTDKKFLLKRFTYENLSYENLSLEFFKHLLKCKSTSSRMDHVNAYIDDELLLEIDKNEESDEIQDHKKGNRTSTLLKEQAHETCSMQCVISLLSFKMDVVLFDNLKKYINMKEKAKLENNLLWKLLNIVPFFPNLKKDSNRFF